jgi:predicted ATPase
VLHTAVHSKDDPISGPSVRCVKSPLLIVLAGRPGTGKTTLARALCARLEAVYVRVDAIETAALRSGLSHPIGPPGYFVAREVVPWDPLRDGPRTVIDTTAFGDAVTAALRACQTARLDR